MHTLSVHRPDQPPERREVAGPLQAGGSHADDVHLPGSPPAAMKLVPCPGGIVIEAGASGVRVGGRPVGPGARRLLRAGERAELHGAAMVLEAGPPADGTRAAAGALLRDAAAGSAPVAGAHLLVLSGPAAGTRHPLRTDQTLGRGRAATIAIPDPHASRVHARIRLDAHGASVEDLGSKNGVRVNGVRIERGACPIRPGDELGIGETALAFQGSPPAPSGPGDVPAAEPLLRARRFRPAPHLVAAALLAVSAAALALAAG